MAPATLFLHGQQIRFINILHTKATVGTAETGLPSLPANWKDRIYRVVIRNIGQPIDWRGDGAPIDGVTDFPALADEIIVYDGADLEAFRMRRAASATADVDVRVIYLGV
jgi:hypothetical protein